MSWRLMLHTSTRKLVKVPEVTALVRIEDYTPETRVWTDDGNDRGYPWVVAYGELEELAPALQTTSTTDGE